MSELVALLAGVTAGMGIIVLYLGLSSDIKRSAACGVLVGGGIALIIAGIFVAINQIG
jgi:hypothetical protein